MLSVSSLKIIFVLFVAKNMDNTLCCGYGSDAGSWFLPARHRLRLQARRAGILDFKRKLSLFIQHQVSSIQYLANSGINDRFYDVIIFGSGFSGLGCVSLILYIFQLDMKGIVDWVF